MPWHDCYYARGPLTSEVNNASIHNMGLRLRGLLLFIPFVKELRSTHGILKHGFRIAINIVLINIAVDENKRSHYLIGT